MPKYLINLCFFLVFALQPPKSFAMDESIEYKDSIFSSIACFSERLDTASCHLTRSLVEDLLDTKFPPLITAKIRIKSDQNNDPYVLLNEDEIIEIYDNAPEELQVVFDESIYEKRKYLESGLVDLLIHNLYSPELSADHVFISVIISNHSFIFERHSDANGDFIRLYQAWGHHFKLSDWLSNSESTTAANYFLLNESFRQSKEEFGSGKKIYLDSSSANKLLILLKRLLGQQGSADYIKAAHDLFGVRSDSINFSSGSIRIRYF